MLSHCWLGDRKGIWPVKISHQQFPTVFQLEDLWEYCTICGMLQPGQRSSSSSLYIENLAAVKTNHVIKIRTKIALKLLVRLQKVFSFGGLHPLSFALKQPIWCSALDPAGDFYPQAYMIL